MIDIGYQFNEHVWDYCVQRSFGGLRSPTIFRTVATAHNDAHRRGVLNIWTIYDHPKDYADSFVSRRYEVGPAGKCITDEVVIGTLKELRDAFMRCGLCCMPRDDSDDAKIVESWL